MRKNLIRTISAITFSILTSCASYIPYPEELQRIKNLPYEIRLYDCKDKSVEDRDFLESKGITSRIVFGKISKDDCNHKPHVWEEVYNPETGKWHVRDATVSYHTGGLEISQYPERQKGKWGDFEEGVTVEDIKNYDKIKKIYWENIPKKHELFFRGKMMVNKSFNNF